MRSAISKNLEGFAVIGQHQGSIFHILQRSLKPIKWGLTPMEKGGQLQISNSREINPKYSYLFLEILERITSSISCNNGYQYYSIKFQYFTVEPNSFVLVTSFFFFSSVLVLRTKNKNVGLLPSPKVQPIAIGTNLCPNKCFSLTNRSPLKPSSSNSAKLQILHLQYSII
jgi:hypothetical protein